MVDRRLPSAADGFDLVARSYERSRPSYPPSVVDLLATELGVGLGARVCDVGAGTGRLTRLLVACGATVVAVEPAAGMRAVLASELPSVTVVDATAEALPFDDEEFDVVTVAQAFHWFRTAEALPEVRRVLRRHGGLAIIDNDLDDRVEWVAALAAISWPAGTAFPVPNVEREPLLQDAGFVDVGIARIEWSEPATRETLASRVRSSGSIAAEPEAVRESLVDRVLALVADRGEPFDMPYVTDVLWCRRGE